MSLSSTLLKATMVEESDVQSIEESTQIVQESKDTEPVFNYINPNAYDHEYGARLIAMETAEALHDVFLESVYGANQLELKAVREHVAFEGSKYEPMLEAMMVNSLEKLKKIVVTLKEKVVAFFNGIMRFIDSIVKNSSKFFAKYDAQIQTLVGLDGFTFKMYEYTHDEFENLEFLETTWSVMNAAEVLNGMSSVYAVWNVIEPQDGTGPQPYNKEASDVALDKMIGQMGAFTDPTGIYNTITPKNINVTNLKEYRQWAFSRFRNGATSPDDKKEIPIPDVYAAIQPVKDFSPESAKKVRKACNTVYDKLISTLDEALKAIKNEKAPSEYGVKVAELLNQVISSVTNLQNAENAYITEWSRAVRERDAAYRQMVMAAFSYAKKSTTN